MTNPVSGPSDEVLEPLDRTLDSLATHGIAAFAVGLLALLVTVAATQGIVHDISHLALPGLLLGIIARRFVQQRRAADSDLVLDGAWSRAREARSRETVLAAIITGAVPIMWLVGGAAIFVRHAHDVVDVALIVGVFIPIGVGIWGVATSSWLAGARERLARALRDTDRRFRAYWQNIGRVA